MAKEKQTRRMIAMALAAAVTVTAVPVDAMAASNYSSKAAKLQTKSDAGKTVKEQKMSRVTVTLEEEAVAEEIAAEEIAAEAPQQSAPEVTVNADGTADAETGVVGDNGSLETTTVTPVVGPNGNVVGETTVVEGESVTTTEKEGPFNKVEVPIIGDGVEPDHYDADGNPVFSGTDADSLPEPEVSGDVQQGADDKEYDYLVKEETGREVDVTITGSDISYDNNKDAYEGEQDLEFMTPIWNGQQLNLGGGTIERFPGTSLEQSKEGYDYTPYGFMHNDVTHMFYIRTDKEGGMVDVNGNAVYYYDAETDTYSRNLPADTNLYNICAETDQTLYYKGEDGTFNLIEGTDESGAAKIDSVVIQANSMMVAFYDKSQKHSDEVWDAADDDLKEIGAMQRDYDAKNATYTALNTERKAYDNSTYTPAKKENDAAKKVRDAANKTLTAANKELTAANKELAKASTEEAKAAAQAKVDAAQVKVNAAQAEFDAADADYTAKNAVYSEYLTIRTAMVAQEDAAKAERDAVNTSIVLAKTAFRQAFPDFLQIADISRLSADYDDDGAVTQDTKDIYNAMFALLQENISQKKFAAPDNIIPAYCVDVNTGTVNGMWYELMNVEDAGYYSTERNEANGFVSDADRIKAIALNGYWGTAEGEVGSLTNMKAFFQARLDEATAKGETLCYTQADIDGLTHGCALSITQHSLWRFGNSLDGAYMDAYTYAYENREERNARIERFIEYFTTMPVDTSVFDEHEVITKDKFIGEMSLTVGDKADAHENNLDNDKTNDAYKSELRFSLVVTPGEGDDLVVSIVSGDEILAKARIAGDGSNDDSSFAGAGDFESDGNGNYTFKNLTLVENSGQTFSLNLEGAQYLEQGVYLFKAAGGAEASQTYTTIASGEKSVDLEMEIDLTFNVEEGSVKETRKWKKTSSKIDSGEYDPPTDPVDPEEDENIEDPEVPLTDVPESGDPGAEEEPAVDIDEEDVPLADAPGESEEPMVAGEEEIVAATGDSNHMAAGFAGMLAALIGMAGLKRRKEN